MREDGARRTKGEGRTGRGGEGRGGEGRGCLLPFFPSSLLGTPFVARKTKNENLNYFISAPIRRVLRDHDVLCRGFLVNLKFKFSHLTSPLSVAPLLLSHLSSLHLYPKWIVRSNGRKRGERAKRRRGQGADLGDACGAVLAVRPQSGQAVGTRMFTSNKASLIGRASFCAASNGPQTIDLVDDRKIRSRGGREGVGIIGDLIFKTAFVDKVYTFLASSQCLR